MQRSQTEDRLKHLLSDREQMTIKAPIDGIVYYGKITRGRTSDATRWPNRCGLAAGLRRTRW